jgi:hypothetical protein
MGRSGPIAKNPCRKKGSYPAGWGSLSPDAASAGRSLGAAIAFILIWQPDVKRNDPPRRSTAGQSYYLRPCIAMNAAHVRDPRGVRPKRGPTPGVRHPRLYLGVSDRKGVLPPESATPPLPPRSPTRTGADVVTRCRGRRVRRHDQAQEGRTKVNAPYFRQSHASLSRNTNDRCGTSRLYALICTR